MVFFYCQLEFFDLFLILGRTTSNFLYLSFFTLYSSSLWRTDTIVQWFQNKPVTARVPLATYCLSPATLHPLASGAFCFSIVIATYFSRVGQPVQNILKPLIVFAKLNKPLASINLPKCVWNNRCCNRAFKVCFTILLDDIIKEQRKLKKKAQKATTQQQLQRKGTQQRQGKKQVNQKQGKRVAVKQNNRQRQQGSGQGAQGRKRGLTRKQNNQSAQQRKGAQVNQSGPKGTNRRRQNAGGPNNGTGGPRAAANRLRSKQGIIQKVIGYMGN